MNSGGNSVGLATISPDGTQLVWSGEKLNGLWHKDLRSKGEKKLSSAQGIGYGYSWQADSKGIVVREKVAKKDRSHLAQLMRIDSMSGAKQALASPGRFNAPLYDPRFTSLTLPLTRQAGQAASSVVPFCQDGNIWLTDGSSSTLLASQAHSAILSPDGQQLVYIKGNDIMLAKLASRESKVLAQGSHPSWSPDSKWLAFVKTEDNRRDIIASEIYIGHSETLAVEQLTNTAHRIELHPSWHPDGRSILYTDHLSRNVFKLGLRLSGGQQP